MDNLAEMDTFLETYSLPRLNHEETKTLNTPVLRKKIESLIKTFQQRLEPYGFTGEVYQAFKEGLIPIVFKCFQKLKKREPFQTHFMKPALP